VEPQERNPFLSFSGRQLFNIRKQGELFQKVFIWWKERLQWMKEDLEHSRAALCGLVGDLRTGKKGFHRDFWKSPFFCTAVITGFVIIGANFYLSQNQSACAAYYNGERIAVVESRQDAEKVRSGLERELEDAVGQDVYLPAPLSYKICMSSRQKVKPAAYYKASLQELPWMVKAVEMCIDGKPAFSLATRQQGEELLLSLQKAMLGSSEEKIEKVDYQEEITFKERQIAVKDLPSLDEALKFLMGGESRQKTYVVQEGDNLWEIARKNDVLVDDLYQANSDLSEDLKPGQELKLTSIEPRLNITITSVLSSNEVLPFDVQTKSDSALGWGKTKVVKDGENGEANVVYRLVRQNQQVVERSEVERQVVKAPVDKIVAKGTNSVTIVASRGSGGGVLRWPAGGGITSGYGPRGGGFHSGIDIGAGYGTAVGAAAAGRIASAGWQGNYGNCVLVSHGNGLSTRYAHLSQINVSTGQSVQSGQLLGRVGQTGRATGPHLHFEVIVNGSTTNPLNYLR
jgi:murein DD-endopeptidase MepM/ murein hydrolase activator NlpD